MSRGGPAPSAGAELITHYASFTGMPTDRLVSGLLTVNVRNDATQKKDANYAYFKGWRANPNSIPDNVTNAGLPPEGTHPYYADPDYDQSNYSPPAFPNNEIFLYGEHGPVDISDFSGTMSGVERHSKGQTGRTYLEVDPTTIAQQLTEFVFPTNAAFNSSNIVDGSYFIVPSTPAAFDGTGALGTGQCGIFFEDTANASHNDVPPAATSAGGINHWVQVDYDSSAGTSATDLATLVKNACNNARNYEGENIFSGCTSSHNTVRIKDIHSARRPDNYTLIATMNNMGSNYSNAGSLVTGIEPDEYGNIYVTTLTKGTKVGFNITETHYYTNEGDTGHPDGVETGSSAGNQKPYTASSAPIKEKELAIGDYDTFLFFVTCACHIHGEKYSSGIWAGYPFPGTHEEGVVPYTINGTTLQFHHHACQHFVRSTLLSRHNNAFNNDRFAGELNTHSFANAATSSWYTGMERNEYTFNKDYPNGNRRMAAADATAMTKGANDYLVNNGIYRHGHRENGIYLDGETGENQTAYGINMSHDLSDAPREFTNCNGQANFFSPVHSINITNAHFFKPMPEGVNTTGAAHSQTSGLRVEINLYAVNPNEADPQSGSPHEFCKAQVNCFWQPFGETAKFAVANAAP